ncbi:hypothetical protein B0A55_08047 [Friedmanniomyces simplex]|uniref:Enoyl reductase (ER) domain-containing protein n=1 Tax=Friedmanniomyces simplex TaxID=329884 RepID=A0A4U0XG91_9PEZI|nr:hypothetical protein B0A55_08047 [Friedmanniomyces simplex]
MRAWQYHDTKGGLENGIRLNTVPLPQPKPSQHLVQVLYAALNPVDYKPAEVALLSRMLIPKPATPGIDFAGRIVAPAAGSSFKSGQIVFGAAGTSPFAAGALREYAVTETTGVVAAPEGLDPKDLATIAIGGETAYQSIVPYVKPGDHILINGGSGGVGVFSIQIAKAVGCKVTTTCSTPNVELCRSLGADVVIDYRKQNVLETLREGGQQYTHVVDNVGGQWDLVGKCHEYSKPGASFLYIGAAPSFSYAWNSLKVRVWPGVLGGARRKFVTMLAQPINSELGKIGGWMKEGTVKPVIDSVWPMEKVSDAFRKLKTGRARGKIVVEVASGSRSTE